MKKCLLTLLTIFIATSGMAMTSLLERQYPSEPGPIQAGLVEPSIENIVDGDAVFHTLSSSPTKVNSIIYHKNKLKTFKYCAEQCPSKEEAQSSIQRIKAGIATEKDLKTASIYDYCAAPENDWELYNYWSLFYHIRELGNEIGWSPEKIAAEQTTFLSKLVQSQKARAELACGA